MLGLGSFQNECHQSVHESVVSLWRISQIQVSVFKWRQEVIHLPTDVTLSVSEFHAFYAGGRTDMVPIFVLSLALGVKSGSQFEDRRCLGILSGRSSQYKYAGCVDDSVC